MPTDNHDDYIVPTRRTFYYGWVIVAASVVIMTTHAGIWYSYSVFFKYLIADFGWSRAATAGVHSLFIVTFGGMAIVMGWLVDRSGPAKVMVFCSVLAGLGLVLTSQITELWQLYVTYGIIVGIGLSAGMTSVTATTVRWFTQRRGLVLGIVFSGVGLGTMILVPAIERLIAAYGWSMAYFILGVVIWVLIIPSSLLLQRNPGVKQHSAYSENRIASPMSGGGERTAGHATRETSLTVKAAVRHQSLWILLSIYFLFNFCLQMVMVHIVNYATDLGTTSLIAATFISFIGVGSFVGRLVMGATSDRIGSNNALLICCTILMSTLVLLIFSRELWMFYLFAIVFGFAYGGEIPQMPILVGRFFGLKAVAALVGIVLFSANIGGAIGTWLAGQIFDVTQSYQIAFMIAVMASFLAVIMTLLLKKAKVVISG